jgi:hypothetical protein
MQKYTPNAIGIKPRSENIKPKKAVKYSIEAQPLRMKKIPSARNLLSLVGVRVAFMSRVECTS